MIKPSLQIMFALAFIFEATQVYAQDIRYVYCTTTLVAQDGSNYQPVRQDQIELFSPIFKVDVHNDDGASSVNFSGDFEITVLRDTKDSRTFAYNQIKDFSLNKRGCNFESKSLEEAKKRYDLEYIEKKNIKPNFQNKCRYIAVYSWIPENYTVLYPLKTPATPTRKVLVQPCEDDDSFYKQ
ncbi:hypothetical protein [Acinetobacter piscicola]|uniref:hypothetical protein n=1 Tax=Acinetobacter piscicola TaxID=2006115 RepID=UPI00101F6897|nr:hypothetical protein [Acinetobacter piscicola]RYL25941.1 hypothetical protein EWP19_10855 [Acinetobacter piscicola]